MTEAPLKPDDPRGKLVLIVDDDEAILTLLEILIQRDGFKVTLATTGDLAIEKLSQKPDMIVLDLILPGTVSGIEVLKHLRGRSVPPPPVLVITGHDTKHPSVVEATRDPNVVQCLAKPIKQDVLLAVLHRYMKTKSPHPPKEAK